MIRRIGRFSVTEDVIHGSHRGTSTLDRGDE
jgi:hypothetical protein